MRYCTECGTKLQQNAKYCTHCGTKAVERPAAAAAAPVIPVAVTAEAPAVSAPAAPQAVTAPVAAPTVSATTVSHQQAAELLQKLSQRLKINGIVWIVIAVLQILLGLTGQIWTLVVGVLNIIGAVSDMNQSTRVLTDPTGIVSKYEPIGGAIVVLIYNLLIGGMIGVIGSIYYFVAIHGYVMEHKQAFLEIEHQHQA